MAGRSCRQCVAGILALAAGLMTHQAAVAQAVSGSGARIVFFQDANFSGETRTVSATAPDLSVRSINAGDFAASLVAYGVWEVCRDPGFRRNCRQVTGLVGDLLADRGTISSARLVRPPTADEARLIDRQLAAVGPSAPAVAAVPVPAARLTLYNHAGYRGGVREIDRDVVNLGDGAWDAGDFAGSLVALGEWEVCMDSNFRTRCRRVNGAVADLGRDSQSISSVRLIRPPTAEEAAVALAATAQPVAASADARSAEPAPAQPTVPPAVSGVAGRIANEAAQAAEQRAREEAARRARNAVGRILGAPRN